ncbi:MAG TPA: PEP-CTERM system histidine kinase PrsK [Verrucomicrobiota bacterium]|nr:PEP-CTERM system histidine kinase PrsK [Verrucomicrobiota bacterium]
MTALSTLLLAAVVSSAGLAAAAVVFRHGAPGRRLFAAGMAVLAIDLAFAGLSFAADTPVGVLRWQYRRLWVMTVLPALWLSFSLCYSRGNYREFLDRWWIVLFASVGVPLTVAVCFSDVLIAGAAPAGPAFPRVIEFGWAGRLLHVLALLITVLTLVNLERTFRTAVGTMRWRIKFVIVGLAVLLGARLYVGSQAFLYSAVEPAHAAVEAGAVVVASLLIGLSVARTGLFEIDVYPSHTVLHNSLTLVLAGVYLLVVGAMAKAVEWMGGDTAFPLKAGLVLVALVGLFILLLSDRVRQRTRRFVSRHFQRPQYDYRRLWGAFTERTASILDTTALCGVFVKLVSETFEVLSVSLWLTDEQRATLSLGASTVVPAGKADDFVPADAAGLRAAIEAIRERRAPFNLEQVRDGWVEALRRCHPDYFGKGGGRLGVPLHAGGSLLGILTLGDRVSGVPFSVEDLDLLQCIGDQVAASLLTLRLSERCLQAKEMEAFQTMSAFFVHDLKNTASTLSLMLGNLPGHFDDPAFREDAFRAIAKAVERINSLIDRLGLLRQELKLNRAEADLNELVRQTLATLEPAHHLPLDVALGALPRFLLDAVQVQNVLTNLLLNAKEALGPDGRIRVQTTRDNGWAVLEVSDNGCGMTPEFVSRSLFRPFQTTKKRGIGIGMYHSRMIVEAHRGRIDVATAVGQGTTFRILLPLAPG